MQAENGSQRIAVTGATGRVGSPLVEILEQRGHEGPEIESGRMTEVAGPREERLADAAALLFASRGDSLEIREDRRVDDPDATAYAEGGVLPHRGARLAGPSFEEWLAAG